MIPFTRMGVTRGKANSATMSGRAFHAYIAINQHRPPMAGVDYVAMPIHEDQVTLFSFRVADDRDRFASEHGAVVL